MPETQGLDGKNSSAIDLSPEPAIEPLPILPDDSRPDEALDVTFPVIHEEHSILGKRKVTARGKDGEAPLPVELQASNLLSDACPQAGADEEQDAKEGNEREELTPTVQGAPQAGLKLLFAASLLQQKKGPKPRNGGSLLIDCPAHNDVCCGRGGSVNKHPGNIIYRKVVEFNKTVYKQVPKRHRVLVPQSIVQTILNSGGRFLMPSRESTSDTSWMEISFQRAVQKTSQALREKPRLEERDTSNNGYSENEQLSAQLESSLGGPELEEAQHALPVAEL